MPSPDNQFDPLASPSWLARHKKIAILGALGVVVVVAAGLAVQLTRTTPATNTTTNQAVNTTTGTTANYARPTFQRSTVTNTDGSMPESYTAPTTQQLQQAITNLSR